MCIQMGTAKAPYTPATPIAPDTGALLANMQRNATNPGGLPGTLLTSGMGVTANAPLAMPAATKTLVGS